MTLADDVRAVLLAANRVERPDKSDARALLLERKRENLSARRDELRRAEGRSLALIRRVDYRSIEPALVPVAPADAKVWSYLRNILSSAPYDNQPGRSVLWFVIDRKSGGVMGVVETGSDLDMLSPRDRYIGWTRKEKYRRHRMNSVANMTTCVVVQPFGALTGGKCAAAMVVSSDVSNVWKRRYRDPLVACSTTSLYGKSSQYNRLPQWRYLGVTPGVGVAALPASAYALIRQFVAVEGLFGNETGHGGNYGGGGGRVGTIHAAANALDVPVPSSMMPKGVYFAEFSEQAKPYLRAEIDDVTIDVPDVASRSAWWMQRWYAMRWPKVERDVLSFDWLSYSLTEQLRARSVDSDAPSDQPGEDGASPSARSTLVEA